MQTNSSFNVPSATWTLNTSNDGKWPEFEDLFAKRGFTLLRKKQDLHEIKATPTEVIAHKASQLAERELAEDTSLDVEGHEIGINVRWLLDNLDKCMHCKAVWRVLLAYHEDKKVHVYEGITKGTIVASRGVGGFGFDPYFLPEGRDKTLAEDKSADVQYNARAAAIEAFVQDKKMATVDMISEWKGEWQDVK